MTEVLYCVTPSCEATPWEPHKRQFYVPSAFYSASQKKFTLVKSPPYKYFKIFSGNFHNVWRSYESLLSNDTKKSDDILCLSEQEPHLWNYQIPGLTGIRICFGCYHEKGFKIIILMVWWQIYERICFAVCISWHKPSTFYSSYSY